MSCPRSWCHFWSKFLETWCFHITGVNRFSLFFSWNINDSSDSLVSSLMCCKHQYVGGSRAHLRELWLASEVSLDWTVVLQATMSPGLCRLHREQPNERSPVSVKFLWFLLEFLLLILQSSSVLREFPGFRVWEITGLSAIGRVYFLWLDFIISTF